MFGARFHSGVPLHRQPGSDVVLAERKRLAARQPLQEFRILCQAGRIVAAIFLPELVIKVLEYAADILAAPDP